MILGLFHAGSGLGNQLHRYIGTRVLAKDRGEEHSMVAPELFKGAEFMDLDMGTVHPPYTVEYPAGKVIADDARIVDAEFQAEGDFIHRVDEIREWLKTEPMEMPDDLCVISHRGGEYTIYPDLYLPVEYWNKAIGIMREKYPEISFEVQTDDPMSAQEQFPDFPIVHNVGHNWRSIRYAKHLIVGNSSFSILPSLLGDPAEIIAPKWHAGYNKGYQQFPANVYSRYIYIHHEVDN
jgi:hypothetical protein